MARGVDRVIEKTKVSGVFGLPIGLYLHLNPPVHRVSSVLVSTVCLNGGHLEAPIKGMLEPESGYETAVFLDGVTFFTVFARQYKSRRAARAGHAATVNRLLAGTLPLSVSLGKYYAWDSEPEDKAA